MLDLFREELRGHLLVVSGGESESVLESLKQIRGAARIVKCEPVERVAVALAAFLSAAREGRVQRTPTANDWLRLAASTLAGAIATDDETFAVWLSDNAKKLDEIAVVFGQVKSERVSVAKELQPEPSIVEPTAPASVATQPRLRPKRSCGSRRRA